MSKRGTLNDIIANFSASTRARNRDLLGGLEPAKREPREAAALDENARAEPASGCSVGHGASRIARRRRARPLATVSIVALRARFIDDLNNEAGCKPLQDAIAASLGIDDGDQRIRWEFGQAETRGREGVCVVIRT